MNLIVFVVFLALTVSANLFAQEIPKLSGIMQGDAPTAIINDQILGVGDEITGCRVVEIGSDYVLCDAQRGPVRLTMTTEQSSKDKPIPKNSVSSAPAKQLSPVSFNDNSQPVNAKAQKSLEKSIDYLKEADTLLKSPFVFERLFAKAIELCESAEREAQGALRLVTTDSAKVGVVKHIEKIRKAKESIVKERADYNTRIRSLISARQVATGMTQKDVVTSWGQPLMRNRDGVLEKWIFQEDNGQQKELVFKDGILVSF